jgi:hypothetical protein
MPRDVDSASKEQKAYTEKSQINKTNNQKLSRQRNEPWRHSQSLTLPHTRKTAISNIFARERLPYVQKLAHYLLQCCTYLHIGGLYAIQSCSIWPSGKVDFVKNIRDGGCFAPPQK